MTSPADPPDGGPGDGGNRREHDWRTVHLWQIQPVRDVLLITLIVLIVLAGYWLSTITVPLLIALTLAYLTEPIVQRVTRVWKWSRHRVVLVLLALATVIIGGFILIAAPLVVGQTIRLINQTPGYLDQLQELLQDPTETTAELRSLVVKAREWIETQGASHAGPAFATAGDAVRFLARIVGSAFYFMFMLFLVPFYYYFFATGFPQITRFGDSLIPESQRDTILPLIRKMDRAVSGFVRGRLVICSLMGLLFAVGWFFCGVPYWLLIGLLTGVFSLVPYLGAVGVPLSVGLLWFKLSGSATPEEPMSYWRLVWPIVVFSLVQFLEGYVLIPLIQGKATNLDPVTLLVAVLAGGSVAGIYGMLLAIPAAACIKILLTDLVWPRFREWAEGRADDPLPIKRE
jgi:predicted PurR-regulated permease PerM